MDVQTMIKLKQPVLLFLTASDAEEGRSFKSVVLGKSEEGILLALPKKIHRQEAPLTRLILGFLWEKNLYQGWCQVLRTEDEPVPCFLATWPDEVEKVQRRSFVRIDLNVKLDLYDPGSRELICQTNTLDLSAGGLAAEVPVALPVGRMLNTRIHLDTPVEVMGKIVRRELRDLHSESYRISLEFEDIKEAEQNAIMRHIFNEQLIRKRKGLL